jgi:hypothetical protein
MMIEANTNGASSSPSVWLRAKPTVIQGDIYIENIVPAPDAWSSPDAMILFDIVSRNTIDISTIRIYIEGTLAWNGSFISPYSGVVKFATGKRFRFEIMKFSSWSWRSSACPSP